MRVVIATHKSWNLENAELMRDEYENVHEIRIVKEKEELNVEMLERYRPDLIFFPHWSYIIPAEIYDAYTCIVFHMTDLPFGRGGSPLQNLIERGFRETKITALKVEEGLDAGPIYFKEPLSLSGSAQEIYMRASDIIFQKMIPKFLDAPAPFTPVRQSGKSVIFKRRKPEQSELNSGMSMEQIYDHIRMLDAEGYPYAYIKMGRYKLSFQKASLEAGTIYAEVMIEEE